MNKQKLNGAPRVNPWFPLDDPLSHKASAGSSAPVSTATSAEADDKSIPPRINAGFPAKADEKRIGVTRFTKKTERAFYFYAMVGMFLFYILSRLLRE